MCVMWKAMNRMSKMSGQVGFCVISCLLSDILILMYQKLVSYPVQNKKIHEKTKRLPFLLIGFQFGTFYTE